MKKTKILTISIKSTVQIYVIFEKIMRYLLILSLLVPLISFGMPNPASVNCIEGYNGKLENGICILKNSEKCEEWALFRGECKFTTKPKKYKKEYNFNGNTYSITNPVKNI